MNFTSILTVNEWPIMQALWANGCATFSEIREAVDDKGWSRHLVTSFLKRMETKGSIRVDSSGPYRVYYPLIDERQAARTESAVFANALNDKSALLFVSNMVREKNLSDEQLDELMRIIEEERTK